MDLLSKFSQLEFDPNYLPQDYHINLYGFSIDNVFDKLKSFRDESNALEYLNKLKDDATNLHRSLEKYSFETFQDTYLKENPEITIAEIRIKYADFIGSIDTNEIDWQLLKTIIEDVKVNYNGVGIISLTTELFDFVQWIEGIIKRKFSDISPDETIEKQENEDKNVNSDVSEKIVWLKGREDFISLIDILIANKFILNRRPIYEHIANHFSWATESMDETNLRVSRSKMKNDPTRQISDDLENTLKILIKRKET